MNEELLQRLFVDAGNDEGRWLLVHGSRGSGKSWWLQRAGDLAERAGFAVHRVNGRDLDDARAASVVAAAAVGRSCALIDDVDLAPTSAVHTVRAAIGRSGGVAVLAAATSGAFEGALAVRVQPLEDDRVVALLRTRGVAAAAADRCATAAGGNPGLAVSLADGLSDDQRADRALVPDLPRLAAHVADELHARLSALGEPACRALMVAAADDRGDLVAVRAALLQLGEDDGAGAAAQLFDGALQAGVVDIVGTRVVFTDPWLRLAAYHLVAPASRRAAHRALAGAYSAPRQGEARVRHLVAAASGPSDDVAEALLVVAAASARRGERAAAARMAMQAADHSVEPSVRTTSLLRAVGWYLDGGDYAAAGVATAELDGLELDEQVATAEVRSLLYGDDEQGGDRLANSPLSERELASWSGRRRQRSDWWAEADSGRHARLIQQIGGVAAAPAELWARAIALRHGGFVRDAMELTERTLGALPPGRSHVRQRWELLAADLAVLVGRFGHAADAVLADDGWQLAAGAAAIRARFELARSPSMARDGSSIAVPRRDPLRSVRTAQLAGLTNGDPRLLVAAGDEADRNGLPIEAGEAWLMAAEVAALTGVAAGEREQLLARAREVLHRCAIRGWDLRLQHIAAAGAAAGRPTGTGAVPAADPALDALSAAEWRVAAAVAGGLTNREVAATLFLSVKTVDFHLQQIYRKLALRSRTELAVRVAGRTGPSGTARGTITQGAAR